MCVCVGGADVIIDKCEKERSPLAEKNEYVQPNCTMPIVEISVGCGCVHDSFSVRISASFHGCLGFTKEGKITPFFL